MNLNFITSANGTLEKTDLKSGKRSIRHSRNLMDYQVLHAEICKDDCYTVRQGTSLTLQNFLNKSVMFTSCVYNTKGIYTKYNIKVNLNSAFHWGVY